MGYYTGTINGYFGFETRMAVIDFQSDKSLKPDGIVNNDTWHALYQVISNDKVEVMTEHEKDDRGQDALNVQKNLSDLGYYRGKIDGKFGSVTGTAVEMLQKDRGLTANGVIDEKTWQAMKETPGQKEKIQLADSWRDLKEGSTGEVVSALQGRLKQVGFFPGKPTSSFGPETRWAVESFELENGLTVDGTVTYDEWEKLVSQTESQALA